MVLLVGLVAHLLDYQLEAEQVARERLTWQVQFQELLKEEGWSEL